MQIEFCFSLYYPLQAFFHMKKTTATVILELAQGLTLQQRSMNTVKMKKRRNRKSQPQGLIQNPQQKGYNRRHREKRTLRVFTFEINT